MLDQDLIERRNASQLKAELQVLNPADFRCAEASQFSTDRYLACAAPAVHFVKNRDARAYPMCDACARHNVENRGAKIVQSLVRSEISTIDDVKASFGQPTIQSEGMTADSAIPTETTITRIPPESEAILISITLESVAPLVKKCLAITVAGVDDKKGIAVAKELLKECSKARRTCENEHKTVKEVALRECQRIDKIKRDILAELEPAEKHVKELTLTVEREQERLKKAAEDHLYAQRLEVLTESGGSCPESSLRVMPATEFDLLMSRVREEARLRKEDQERRDAEAKRLKEEQDKLATERAEFDRKQREQAEETARLKKIDDDKRAAEQAKLDEQRRKIEADQKRLDDEAADRQRKIDDERLKTEAAERSRVETEARLKREADEAERTRLAKEAADRRDAAMRPDREKLLAVADAVEAIELPTMIEPDSLAIKNEISEILQSAARLIRKAVNKSA